MGRRWFKRHGDATVFFARMLPLVRAFISLPAGVAKMPFWRFTWLTALGSLPWVLGFGLIGRRSATTGSSGATTAGPRLPRRRAILGGSSTC
jgi:membrane protein DedA with SNARE-associated domain